MNSIAIIPARSGSKGVKDKNIRILNGKPLIYYTVQAALQSKCFDKVMVSTDSSVYADIAVKCGAEVPFLRSKDKSLDTSGSWDVVREVLNRYNEMGLCFEKAALLQPTSPLRDADDIKGACDMFLDENVHAIVSVTAVEHPVQWCFRMNADGYIGDVAKSPYINMRRQELEKYYRENGAIYIVNASEILDPDYNLYAKGCYGYEMKSEKSVDIDTEIDLKFAEFLMNEMKNNGRKE